MKKEDVCSYGTCPKCKAGKLLVLGILILINTYYPVISWAGFVGGIIVIAGLLKLLWPTCPHCK